MGSHSVTCHPTRVNAPRLNPSHAGRYSIYLTRRDGRLSWPCYSETQPPGVELATSRSRIQRANHWATKQTRVCLARLRISRHMTDRRQTDRQADRQRQRHRQRLPPIRLSDSFVLLTITSVFSSVMSRCTTSIIKFPILIRFLCRFTDFTASERFFLPTSVTGVRLIWQLTHCSLVAVALTGFCKEKFVLSISSIAFAFRPFVHRK